MIVFDKQNFEQENLNSYKKTYTKKGTVFVQITIISILIFLIKSTNYYFFIKENFEQERLWKS